MITLSLIIVLLAIIAVLAITIGIIALPFMFIWWLFFD